VDLVGLGAFLRSRRAALQPEDVGLPRGPRRRTSGLRREEVASLVGMSPDYYARLERGAGLQPSEQMVAAIARGMRLSLPERDHLFTLAGLTTARRTSRTDHVGPALMRVVDRLQDTPAQVMGGLGERTWQGGRVGIVAVAHLHTPVGEALGAGRVAGDHHDVIGRHVLEQVVDGGTVECAGGPGNRDHGGHSWLSLELELTSNGNRRVRVCVIVGNMTVAATTRSEVRSTIVECAARLLREHGPAAVTTRGVAEAAGVQAPTIYRLLGDKDGLLDAVAEHVVATYVTAKAEVAGAASADDVDPVEDLRSGWQTYIDFGLANPTLFALLSDPARSLSSPAARSGQHVLEARVHRVALTGRLRVGEARAVDVIHAAGTGAVLTLLSTSRERRDLGLADDLLDAVLLQILLDAPAPAERTHVAPAVALRATITQLDVLRDAERQLLADWLDRIIEAG